jgi:hypothetical protein
MLVGAILTAFGIVALVLQGGIHYTTREKFPAEGSTQVITKQEKIISVPPAIGVAALAGGLVIMILAARR